jgi:hypothetical protein
VSATKYLRGELQCDFVHTLLAAVAQIEHLKKINESVRIIGWREEGSEVGLGGEMWGVGVDQGRG